MSRRHSLVIAVVVAAMLAALVIVAMTRTRSEDRMGPQALVAFVKQHGGDSDQLVEVDLELFFEGNDVVDGSIAPNLDDHPGPRRIYDVLRRLRARDEVADIKVVVRLEMDEYPPGDWPFGEAVHVYTTLTPTEVDAATAELAPDPSGDEPWAPVTNPSPIAPGYRIVTVWWD